MGETLASVIIADVAERLNDTNNYQRRWPDTVLLSKLNQGQKLVASAKPACSITNATIELTDGFTQELPDDAKGLSTIDYNAGTTGLEKGKYIQRIPVAQLDEIEPEWRNMTETDVVEYYYYDASDPYKFGVYPPNTGNQQIHIVYPSIPSDCATVAAKISISDEWVEALTQATIWYALSDKSEYEDMRRIRAEALAYLKLSVDTEMKTEEPAE